MMLYPLRTEHHPCYLQSFHLCLQAFKLDVGVQARCGSSVRIKEYEGASQPSSQSLSLYHQMKGNLSRFKVGDFSYPKWINLLT